MVIERIQSELRSTATYKKAWWGKQRALQKAYGGWAESYAQLPRWFAAFEFFNPGTIIAWDHNGMMDGPIPRFVFGRVFWAFKPCINAFAYMKPIIQIDGTHLYGRYTGSLLIAMTQDGDGHLLPVAFAIVESETIEAWTFFLYHLRIHVAKGKQDICLISDRHKSILVAVSNPNLLWQPPMHIMCFVFDT